jgi:hypothetical protein
MLRTDFQIGGLVSLPLLSRLLFQFDILLCVPACISWAFEARLGIRQGAS